MKGKTMSQSPYAWMGSPLHLVLEDELADAFNRAQQAFFNAQINHEKLHGHKWEPVTEAIAINWTNEEQAAWDNVGKVINLLIEINGGGLEITEEQMTSDFLVKL